MSTADIELPEPAIKVGDERPIGEIVSDLWSNTETLIRQEFQLGLADVEQRVHVLKAEVEADVGALKREIIRKTIGGAIAFAGMLSLAAALVLLLAQVLSPWLSALIVGLVITAGGASLLVRSIRPPAAPDATELLPKRAVQSVKEDARTIQEAMK